MNVKAYFSDEKTRFEELKGIEFKHNPTAEQRVLNVYTDLKFQEIIGFGGAFTDASATNYALMSDKTKKEFIDLLFDKEKGLGYTFCRGCIGSSDFAKDSYGFIEENDISLETFDIFHDKQEIIPMMKDAIKKAGKINLLCSPWSPPAFMKSNNQLNYGGKLKPEFYTLWANFYVKFIKEYKNAGVEISYLTVQNEPMASQTWESCEYTIEEELLFARDYLRPALNKAGLDTKILVWDHNKEHVYDYAKAIKEIEGVKDSIDGIGFHWYSGNHFENLNYAHYTLPEKLLVSTEFCCDIRNKGWGLALGYANDIIGNLNNFMNASCDWNMVLDTSGAPFHWRRNGCNAVVLYNKEEDKIEKQEHYYAMKHISSFIKPGAIRLGTSTFNINVKVTAAQNENGEIVIVIVNNIEKEFPVLLRLDNFSADVTLTPKSITTLVVKQ
ncbi:MAG: glucosylceramidase [Clostridia bacterium]|nr:glucosylceramidase [Clostridia bacterium]